MSDVEKGGYQPIAEEEPSLLQETQELIEDFDKWEQHKKELEKEPLEISHDEDPEEARWSKGQLDIMRADVYLEGFFETWKGIPDFKRDQVKQALRKKGREDVLKALG